MKNFMLGFGFTLLLTTLSFGQAKPQAAPPAPTSPAQKPVTLNPEVALKIRAAQHAADQTQLQLAALTQQYNQLVQRLTGQLTEQQGKLTELEKTALKDSGLDEGKYVLDPDTLDVKVKPAPPAPTK